MSIDSIHVLKNRLERNSNIFLLLIPLVVFVLVLSVFIAVTNRFPMASYGGPTVLGDETIPLDNQTIFEGEY